MKLFTRFFAFILITSLIIGGCSQKQTIEPTQTVVQPTLTPTAVEPSIDPEIQSLLDQDKFVFHYDFYSENLAANMIEDAAFKTIHINIPESYYTSDKNYPVVYFLEGHSENATTYTMYGVFQQTMLQEGMHEFIVVNLDGRNKFSGSFYANSPVIGNWEDFIVKELVPFIDTNFRTIESRESRGISGFSMGGSGAVNIGLKYPEVFGAIYTLSPGILPESDGIEKAMKTWNSSFRNGYGAAFSPNVDGEYPYANIPQFDGTEEDEIIIQQWETGYGNIDSKIKDFMEKNLTTKIRIEVDPNDYYKWLGEGTVYFHTLLSEYNIDHTFIEHNRSHNRPETFYEVDFVEFFSDSLSFID